MDERTIGPPEIVGIASVGLFLVALFLPWFTVSVDDPSGIFSTANLSDLNGWDAGYFFSLLPLLLGLAMLALLLAPTVTPDLDLDLPTWLPLALGGTAALLVLLRILLGATVNGAANAETFGASIDVARGIGIFVAFLATLGMSAAGFLTLQAAPALQAPGGQPDPSPTF